MSAIELPLLRSPSVEAARAERNAQTLAYANAIAEREAEPPTIQQVESDAPETKKAAQASFKNYFVSRRHLVLLEQQLMPASASSRTAQISTTSWSRYVA